MKKDELRGQPEYDDSFPTCAETFSTLRIFSDDISPDEITKLLQIEPSKTFRKGDIYNRKRSKREAHGWFYGTERLSASKDTRRHLDLILTALEGKDVSIKRLQDMGVKIDIMAYWLSGGQGGPWMMPYQMLRLGTLGVNVWWDIYFSEQRARPLRAAL